MSQAFRSMREEFEADYKVEPSFHVSNQGKITNLDNMGVRDYNIGNSDYSTKKIQPWDIWLEYQLNPWDADIVKRVLRTKQGEDRKLDYQKIVHICQERIRQLEA
jgi:hypothetical protein